MNQDHQREQQHRQAVIRKFEADADASYDRQRRALIPCFDEFYGTAIRMIESGNPAPHILDLGTGTGLLAAMALDKYPEATLTLIDSSESMLDQARRRFAGRANVRYVVGDYTEHAFDERFCFVISSLSIHHLEHPDKRKLFSAVHDMLKPGGAFINADQSAGRAPAIDELQWRFWLSDVTASGLPQESIEASIERRRLDRNAKLEDQLRWMEEAGFADVDCVYRNLGFAVMYGKRGA